jgi:hypothetical protein
MDSDDPFDIFKLFFFGNVLSAGTPVSSNRNLNIVDL